MELSTIIQWGVTLVVYPLVGIVYRLTVSASEKQLESARQIISQSLAASEARITRLEAQTAELSERLHQHQLAVANTYVKHEELRLVMDELRKLEGKLDRVVANMAEMSKYFTEKLHAPRP